MSAEFYDRFADYLRWANSRTLASLTECETVPNHAIRTFAHLLSAEEIWLQRLKGISSSSPVWPERDSLDGFAGWIERNAEGYRVLVAQLSDDKSFSEVNYSNSKGERFTSRVTDVLLHVIAHGSYHRGQLALTVKAQGGTPAVSDYILFTRASS